MRRATVTSAVLVALLGSGTVLGAGPARTAAYVPADETKVEHMVNATRSSKGLGRLRRVDALVGMARRQADKMAAKGSIFHNPNLGGEMTTLGVDWGRAGENVGMGPDVTLVEEAFINSPHHYENIVAPSYDAVGIGVVDGADERRYVVQVFADLRSSETAATAAAPKPEPATTAEPQAQRSFPIPQATAATPQSPSPSPSPASPSAPAASSRPPSVVPNAVTGGVVKPLVLPMI